MRERSCRHHIFANQTEDLADFETCLANSNSERPCERTVGAIARSLAVSVRETGLEIGKLFRLVREDVAAASALVQETFVYGSLPGEDFYFSQPDVK